MQFLRRTGFFAYHAVPTNSPALSAFRHYVTDLWRRTLRRRSQKAAMTWARITQIADAWLPKPGILHPWPDQRFAVTHPRWEPMRESRTLGSVRGVSGNWYPYRDPRSSRVSDHLESSRSPEIMVSGADFASSRSETGRAPASQRAGQAGEPYSHQRRGPWLGDRPQRVAHPVA